MTRYLLTQTYRGAGMVVVAAMVWGHGGSRLQAQSGPELGIALHPAIEITGNVGAVYALEYVPSLDLTNSASAWQCLELVQLPSSPFTWVDRSASVADGRYYRATLMSAPTNMVFIPTGTFRMGSPTNEVGREVTEGPQTAVTMSRGYWMGRYEVTQGEYRAVMGKNPSYHVGNSLPVERVTWIDATNYCARLTSLALTAGQIPNQCVYRLPTEAEWEYACRAWTSTRFSYGDDPGYTNLTSYAWYQGNSGDATHPVGQKLANPWGLFDVHGNVREWVADRWADRLPGGTAVDPQGPTSGASRVACGGDYYFEARESRSAVRNGFTPDDSGINIGFRVVLAPQ